MELRHWRQNQLLACGCRWSVYVGSQDHTLYALSAQAGKKLWSYTTGSGIVSSPAVVNGVVYVGSNDHNLYAFNQTSLSPSIV
jgi:outer membrane protein assembly factor BamB